MKPINVSEKLLNREHLKQIKNQQPSINHVSKIVNDESLVIKDGEIVAVYKKAPFNISKILLACQLLKFVSSVRFSGINSYTINLNASPRNPRLDNRCWQSKLKRENPIIHDLFIAAARQLAKYYHKYFKQRFLSQVRTNYSGIKRVDSTYRISGTPFTGGVINKDSALSYHFDSANKKGGISCMLIFKKNQAGGELILPQLDIGFACQDGYMLLFDGKTYLHGVTPILKHQTLKGYRYTIVFYNNEGMELCLPPDDEERHYQKHLEKQSDKINITT